MLLCGLALQPDIILLFPANIGHRLRVLNRQQSFKHRRPLISPRYLVNEYEREYFVQSITPLLVNALVLRQLQNREAHIV